MCRYCCGGKVCFDKVKHWQMVCCDFKFQARFTMHLASDLPHSTKKDQTENSSGWDHFSYIVEQLVCFMHVLYLIFNRDLLAHCEQEYMHVVMQKNKSAGN